MEISVVKKDDKTLLLEFKDESFTLTNVLREFLFKDENVLEAADFQEHPLLENPKLWVKVEKGSPITALKKAARNALKEVEQLKKEVEKTLG